MQEKALPRHGYAILAGERQIGTITSGGYSPTLDSGIGMGYVPVGHEAPGTLLEIDLRGRPSPAQDSRWDSRWARYQFVYVTGIYLCISTEMIHMVS